jgi:hypothetical protein
MRRAIWSETLPYERACAPEVLGLLRRFDVEIFLAVRPWDLDALPRALAAAADAGVRAAAWPMVDDAEGRWANARNADAYAAFARRVRDAGARALAIDLEPPIEDVRALLHGARSAARVLGPSLVDFARARDLYAALVDELRADGVATIAAVLPHALLDEGAHDRGARWQRLAGTPVDGPRFDRVSVMLYTSMVEGWSRGLFDRGDARAVLAGASRITRERFADVGGVSLGAVGTGAFGDEPVYRSVEELRDDVAIARACGIDDLALFDLGGVLARPPAEAWLEALARTEAGDARPPKSIRAHALRALVRWVRGAR